MQCTAQVHVLDRISAAQFLNHSVCILTCKRAHCYALSVLRVGSVSLSCTLPNTSFADGQ